MGKEPFDPKEYEDLTRRVEALRNRIRLDPPESNERKIAQTLLPKVEARLKEYEQEHDIPSNYATSTDNRKNNTTYDPRYYGRAEEGPTGWAKKSASYVEDRSYHKDNRSKEELDRDLGVLYSIFGSTYYTKFEGNVYKIRLKKRAQKAIYSLWNEIGVYADIYENDTLITGDMVVTLRLNREGRCCDVGTDWWDESVKFKYFKNCYVYKNVVSGMQVFWNNFFFGDSASLVVRGGSSLLRF